MEYHILQILPQQSNTSHQTVKYQPSNTLIVHVNYHPYKVGGTLAFT